MSFLINEQVRPSGDGDDTERWLRQLQEGNHSQRRLALRRLVAAGAEAMLARCLLTGDEQAVRLATGGLWECWLNEKGPKARREMNQGIALMEAGELEEAARRFTKLSERHPDWAEALNKLATVQYLRGLAGDGLDLCEMVVELKPHHFGAWNGMALCAVQLGYWETALRAARQALALHPRATANLEILELVRSKMGR